MAILVDTNVLLFCVQQTHPRHTESVKALEAILVSNESVCVLPQIIAEFWNVCTRPLDKNGLGLSPNDTALRLGPLESILTVLHDTPEVYHQWRTLLLEHAVKGIQVHDARIAASMRVHGIERILTYNPRDFMRFTGINPISPAIIAAQ